MSRLVLKVGTSLLTDTDGKLRVSFLGKLCEEMATLKQAGHEVVLISSGAMAAGAGILNSIPHDLEERPLFACVGQSFLMKYYQDFCGIHGIVVAQALLTWRNFEKEKTRTHVKTNMERLLENSIIPIVNENDLVSDEEISFGDNDQMSAKVAVLLNADRLIILSDVDGVYDKNPHEYKDAKRFTVLSDVSEELLECVGKKTSQNSLGGMKSKLLAAKYALESGIPTTILSGVEMHDSLERLVIKGELVGTTFQTNKEG